MFAGASRWGRRGKKGVGEHLLIPFDYSDGILPSHGLSVCAGRVQGASVKAGWLHSHEGTGEQFWSPASLHWPELHKPWAVKIFDSL